MERKLRYLEKEIKKDGIPMVDSGESPEAPQPREMIDLEVKKKLKENPDSISAFEIFIENSHSAGNIRKTRKWIAWSKPKRRSIEAQLLGINWIEAYSAENSSLFRRGKRQ